MSDYYEFTAQVRCPHCGNGQIEYVEFEIENRTTIVLADERKTDCDGLECGKKFYFKPSLFIEVEATSSIEGKNERG